MKLLGPGSSRGYQIGGGVSMIVRSSVKLNEIDITHICMDQDIECCTVQLESKFLNVYVFSMYRAPTGDTEKFLRKSGCIMNYLYNSDIVFIVYGDIKMYFLTGSHFEQCLISLLESFNLTPSVNFSARIKSGLSTTTDNNFVASTRKDCCLIRLVINGLSDHDTQQIVTNNIKPIVSNYDCRVQSRLVMCSYCK
jgi:hypothetical protein